MTLRALPLWFGPPARPLLGFYHAGAPDRRRAGAVVLCYPLGHEYTAVYQAYRQLAERLAEAGFPVFRFDYDGTGDSAGDDSDPDRLTAWRASIALALQQALERSGATSACLFGLRLGALLAYAAAADNACVRDLILWAPPLTGKSYLREWRALRLLKTPATTEALADGAEESGGFLMTQQTTAELARIDLLTKPQRGDVRTLLLARDALLAEQRLADALRARGGEVDYRFIPGYAGLVVEPYNVVIPELVFIAVVAHLEAVYPESAAAPPKSADHPRQMTAIPHPGVKEQALYFGPDAALFGVLSEPADKPSPPSQPALILLNTSVIHRVGPNRMYVPMARRWAAAGWTVLRLDVAGLGDSPRVGWQPRQSMYAKDGVHDVRAAMDLLAAHRGRRHCILVGLCSGAYLAFHAGLVEPRVLSQVLLNPQTFEWKEGDSLDVDRKLEYKSFRFYLRTAAQRQTWARLFRGEVHWQGILSALAERASKQLRTKLGQKLGALLGKSSAESSVLAKFRTLLQGDRSMLLLYSQEDPGLDELSLHLGKDASLLRPYPRFTLELVDGPDHTFTSVWSQHRLEQLITAYLAHFA